jgi:hypothetical protein
LFVSGGLYVAKTGNPLSARRLGQDFLDHFACDVSQAEIATGVAVREPFVI